MARGKSHIRHIDKATDTSRRRVFSLHSIEVGQRRIVRTEVNSSQQCRSSGLQDLVEVKQSQSETRILVSVATVVAGSLGEALSVNFQIAKILFPR